MRENVRTKRTLILYRLEPGRGVELPAGARVLGQTPEVSAMTGAPSGSTLILVDTAPPPDKAAQAQLAIQASQVIAQVDDPSPALRKLAGYKAPPAQDVSDEEYLSEG